MSTSVGMRVLATCQPALGHFEPMAPLARALVEAGHEVVVATTEPFRPWVEAAGFPSVAAGFDWLESDVGATVADLGGWRAVFARAAAAALPDLVGLIGDLRPDLVLGESLDLCGPLAAEAGGVPHALVGIGAPRPLPVLAAAVGPHWEMARAALGLDPDPGLDRHCPLLYLDTCPPSLRPYEPARLLPSSRPLRPGPAGPAAPAAPAAPWLDVLGRDRPLVYATLGTVSNRAPGVLEAILEALAGEPVDAVVAVGPDRDPATVAPRPDHVRVEQFVPQAAVLERAAAVVCHAGFGTAVAALAHGVPVVGLPLGADNHYNAFRVAACGAGLALDGRAATPGLVRAALRTVLGDGLYRANARRVGREIAAMPPPAAAVALLEQVAEARQQQRP